MTRFQTTVASPRGDMARCGAISSTFPAVTFVPMSTGSPQPDPTTYRDAHSVLCAIQTAIAFPLASIATSGSTPKAFGELTATGIVQPTPAVYRVASTRTTAPSHIV